MKVQSMPAYLYQITSRANRVSDALLQQPLWLYHHRCYNVPYQLSKYVIYVSKSYQHGDYVSAMAAAAILDYQVHYYTYQFNYRGGGQNGAQHITIHGR